MKVTVQTIERGDAVPWLAKMRARTSDLFFADPPFNIGHKYDVYRDDQKREIYLEWCAQWMFQASRILKTGGAFWLAISDENVSRLDVQAEAFGFVRRNWVIWNYNFGQHLNVKFGRDKTHLLYYVLDPRGRPAYWNPPRIESERQRLGDKRANPAGRIPGDVWQYPRVCGNFKERTEHPAQMPEALIERILRSCVPPRGRVVDPFAGSGVVEVVARRLGMNAWGCEMSKAYTVAANERLELEPYARGER